MFECLEALLISINICTCVGCSENRYLLLPVALQEEGAERIRQTPITSIWFTLGLFMPQHCKLNKNGNISNWSIPLPSAAEQSLVSFSVLFFPEPNPLDMRPYTSTRRHFTFTFLCQFENTDGQNNDIFLQNDHACAVMWVPYEPPVLTFQTPHSFHSANLCVAYNSLKEICHFLQTALTRTPSVRQTISKN